MPDTDQIAHAFAFFTNLLDPLDALECINDAICAESSESLIDLFPPSLYQIALPHIMTLNALTPPPIAQTDAIADALRFSLDMLIDDYRDIALDPLETLNTLNYRMMRIDAMLDAMRSLDLDSDIDDYYRMRCEIADLTTTRPDYPND